MKKTALLIDGGWFAKGLAEILKPAGGWPIAEQICKNAAAALENDEELFRIFYYDCEPFDQVVTNPVDGSRIDYRTTTFCKIRKHFFFALGQMPFVALRRGELVARGWELSEAYKKALMKGGSPAPLRPTDVYPNLQQKGVDMHIGMDVATLALSDPPYYTACPNPWLGDVVFDGFCGTGMAGVAAEICGDRANRAFHITLPKGRLISEHLYTEQ